MLGGTVSDFDLARPSMLTLLAREADTSTEAVYLTLKAGSVIVEAELYFGTADGATFAAAQLAAGILASPAALEAALNAQFQQDGVDVSASVQQILVAPEYDANEAKSKTKVAVVVGVVVAVLVLCVVVGVVLRCRMKQAAVTGELEQRAHAEPAQVVNADPVLMGIPVGGTPQVATATPMGGVVGAPPLPTMVEIFRRQLSLGGGLSINSVVEQACVQLGADPTQGSLVERAQRCWELLGCPKS